MKRILPLLLLVSLAPACTKDDIHDPALTDPDALEVHHGMIVLGEKLEDPYSVSNITKALESLYPSTKVPIITPTDYYVRFLPSDESQLERLGGLGLELIDHPMDYRIVKEGDYYFDPDLGDNPITWQYSVVPSDFEFPEGIRYEIIDLCFLSEHAPSTKVSDTVDWAAVEEESFRLTGNSDLLRRTRAGVEPAAPQGRITIIDSDYDSEPVGVAGVKVVCNSFVKIASCFTDEEGYYKMNKSYSTEIRYRLVFKNSKGFGIGLNMVLSPASTSALGKNGPQGVSVTVDDKSDKWLYARCAANNAAYEFWTMCGENGLKIKTPPSNLRLWLFHSLGRSFSPMLQQGALIDGSFVEEFMGEYYPLLKIFLPDVFIGLGSESWNYRRIRSEVIHQLAHSVHYLQAGDQYWAAYAKELVRGLSGGGSSPYGEGTSAGSGYLEIAEMWAYYMQTMMERSRYDVGSAVYGSEYWFYPQIFIYLDERGLNRSRLFQALGSDIADRQILQAKLTSLYPENKAIINQAFLRYF